MWPTLIDFGSLVLPSRSLLMVLAFLSMAFIFWRKTREEHYQEDQAFDAFLLSSVVALVAGRLAFGLWHLPEWGVDIWRWFDVVNHPGTSLGGGLAAGSVYLYFYAQKRKWDVFEILDFWFMGLSLGMVWRYLGDFLAGTGFGYATTLPWGMVFPGVFEKHHPLQLYHALFFLLLFIYLSRVEYHYRTFSWYRAGRKSAQTGFLTSCFMICSGLYLGIMQLLTPAQLSWQGINFDLVLYGLLLVAGVVNLYQKSGRKIFFGQRKLAR